MTERHKNQSAVSIEKIERKNHISVRVLHNCNSFDWRDNFGHLCLYVVRGGGVISRMVQLQNGSMSRKTEKY